MKINKYIIILAGLLIVSCGSDTKEPVATEKKSVQENVVIVNTIAEDVSAEEFKSFITEFQDQLIDVRTPEEYEMGTIETAINIDFLGENFMDELNQLDPDKPVLVFCKSGGRSSRAMEKLTEAGFKEVYNLLGGYSGWPKQ